VEDTAQFASGGENCGAKHGDESTLARWWRSLSLTHALTPSLAWRGVAHTRSVGPAVLPCKAAHGSYEPGAAMVGRACSRGQQESRDTLVGEDRLTVAPKK